MRALRRALRRAAAAAEHASAAGAAAPLAACTPLAAHLAACRPHCVVPLRMLSAWPAGSIASAAVTAAEATAASAPRAALPALAVPAAASGVARALQRGVAGTAAAAAQPAVALEAAATEVSDEPPLPPGAQLAAVPQDHVITVKAFYIAQRIDLGALAAAYAGHEVSQHRDSVIVSLNCAPPPEVGAAEPGAAEPGASVFPYVSVTGFGAVVFFDVSAEAQGAFLAAARKAAVKPLPSAYCDSLQVCVRPSLQAWSRLHADTLSLRALDANNLRVVSSVLAQSVALAHFESKVDSLLELFGALNKEMEAVGRLPLPKRRLFQLVAENNSILTDVITKVGLLSRSDAAWAAARYSEVFDGLRTDFELDDRFESMHFKLELIATQLRFHMDVLQNRKSDALEWTIIVLIAAEIAVSLYDLATRI